jgi:hypothetical protein
MPPTLAQRSAPLRLFASFRINVCQCLSYAQLSGFSKYCGKGELMVTRLHEEDLSREYPSGNRSVYGLNLPSEIERRERLRNGRILTAIVIAAISAFFSMVAAIASLITIFLGRD